MSFLLPAIPALLSAAGSLSSASAAKKAAKAKVPQIDIAALNNLVSQQAGQNARASLALENELTPENQQLRRSATSRLLQQINRGTPEQDQAISSLLAELQSSMTPAYESALRSPLLERTIAQAGSDLSLGGTLPQDVRNQVTRRSISTAGAVGGGRLGTSRALAPRDLGLTSLDLQNRRLQNAATLGQQEAGYNSSRLAQRTNTRSSLAQLLAGLAGTRTGQSLSLASFANSLLPPQVGLNPGNVADIVGTNQQNVYQGQLNRAALGNQANQSLLQGLGTLYGQFYPN